VRQTAWLSLLSGAVGYTAGINEVYAWEDDALVKMDVPSSDEVALLGRVLRAVPWWRLEPAPGCIRNQPGEAARLMAFAITPDRALGLAYLPENASIEIDLGSPAGRYATLWVNPATGACQDGPMATAGRASLSAPDRRDWVLVLALPGSPALTQVRKALASVPPLSARAEVAITFGKKARPDGLVLKQPADGRVTSTRVAGVDCVVNERPQRNTYLYLDLDDRLAFRGGLQRMRVEVRLQSDSPLTGIRLEYDAEGPGEIANVYRSVPPAWRKQEGAWTVVGFTAEQPYLGNRQNAGADFRVFLDRSICLVSEVTVTLERGALGGGTPGWRR